MNQDLLTSLLNTIEPPALLMDSHYNIIACNNAYQSRYQVQAEALATSTCYQVSHGYSRPCDEEGESCPLKSALDSGKPERVLHIHNTPEGKEHIDVHLEPIFDSNGKLIYFIETLHDINKTSSSHKSAKTLLLGQSKAFNHMLAQLTRAANANISVLLLGESGTGKELAAKFLHENSARKNKPFVTVECSGLTDTLFESELFGHVKGAFTGATQNKEGLVAAAQGGTLFLDELGDIPLSQQVKLLRLLETGVYRQVGSVVNCYSDFRLVCATNKDLKSMVSAGEFREDLFYRINAFPVYLPALNERQEDITIIAKSMLLDISQNLLVHFSEEALDFLARYSYPGNIRELRNMIERANIMRNDNRIELNDIAPERIPFDETEESNTLAQHEPDVIPLAELEQTYLEKLNHDFKGNKSELAHALGISERTLYRKLKAFQH